MDDEVEYDIRLAAVIQLKNATRYAWLSYPDEEGKNFIRSTILSAIVAIQHHKIQKFLCIILRNICYADFPEQLPDLQQQIIQYFHNTDLPSLIGASNAAFIVIDTYQTLTGIRDFSIDYLLSGIHERMLGLCEDLVKPEVFSLDSAELLRRILRIIFLIVRSSLMFAPFSESPFFQRWMIVIFKVYAYELPPSTAVCSFLSLCQYVSHDHLTSF